MRLLTLLFALSFAISSNAADKPNILFIMADDMGYGDCTAYNPESKVRTPNIDRLAREGLLFTDAHSASATCTASRYGLLTGINPSRRGVVNGITGIGPVLEKHEVTIAELLREHGYSTSMVGKWHLGFEMKPAKPRPVYDFSKPFTGGPIDHGFDSFFGLRQAVSSAPYFYIRDRDSVAIPSETTPGTRTIAKAEGKNPRTAYGPGEIAPGFVPEEAPGRLCDEVVALLKDYASGSDQTKPFFLYYAMLQPHTPWIPEDRFEGKSKAGPYGDYLVQMDHEVGRVLETLRDTELDRNTLVIFTSDNGAHWSDEDIERWGHRANGPLAKGKAHPEEGGHRLPFIARWPGVTPAAARTDATINHTDFLATVADLLGVEPEKLAPEAVKDSHSFLSVLRDPEATHERTAMAVTTGSFRQGDWKLTFNRGRRSAGPKEREAGNASLYHLAEDLGETQDLSASHPERKQQLFAAYQEYFADRKLKPLAEQVAARKANKKPETKSSNPRTKKPSPKPKAAATETNLTELRQKRTNLQKQLDNLLTKEQKLAQAAARKKALAEGKGGVPLRNALDAALNLTTQQKKQFDELRKEISQLTRELRNQPTPPEKTGNPKPSPEGKPSAETARAAWIKLCGSERKASSIHFKLPDREPNLPNAFLYGDSISIGYTPHVRTLLTSKANVYRLPGNGGQSSKFIPTMKRVLETMRDERLKDPWDFKWDVIHLNVGLHDLKYVAGRELQVEGGKQVHPVAEYEQNLRAIFDFLKQTEPDTRIVFATTTPVPAEGAPGFVPGNSERYNEVARRVLRDYPQVSVNDLYAHTRSHHEWYIQPSNVHFGATGREAQAAQVAKAILAAAAK